jgi:hypothetical protein
MSRSKNSSGFGFSRRSRAGREARSFLLVATLAREN